jgi:hypothetical protein
MALWTKGVCDSILVKVLDWKRRWPAGAVAATREFMHKTGSLEGIPTKRAVKVAWHPKELEHLIRILKAAKPEWQFVVDLEEFYNSGFRRGRLLPGGLFLTDMVAYGEDLDEMLEILVNASAGRVAGQIAKEVKSGSFWDAVR